jgi:hypothetical protein
MTIKTPRLRRFAVALLLAEALVPSSGYAQAGTATISTGLLISDIPQHGAGEAPAAAW